MLEDPRLGSCLWELKGPPELLPEVGSVIVPGADDVLVEPWVPWVLWVFKPRSRSLLLELWLPLPGRTVPDSECPWSAPAIYKD